MKYCCHKYTKCTPKYTFLINFDNKVVELIRISQIFNHPDVTETLPCDIQNKENINIVTYQLGNTVRNKLLNYKETVNSVFVNEEAAFD